MTYTEEVINSLDDTENKKQPQKSRTPVESTEQLYQDMILGGRESDYTAVNDYMATAFLDEDELHAVRSHANAIQQIENLANMIKGKEYNKFLHRIKDTLVNNLNTILHSSKSREGGAYKVLITQQNIGYSHFKEETDQDEGSWGFGENREQTKLGLDTPDPGRGVNSGNMHGGKRRNSNSF